MKAKTPYLFKLLLPQLTWQIKTEKKEIFLTFDDGPHPVLTKQVMDVLDQFQAKATFFCVGQNVEKFPETYAEILDRGHKTGNHTFNHLNGWKVDSSAYLQNVEKCAEVVDSDLFRPPYGRIGLKQISRIRTNYRIVMWSVLTLDFDSRVTQEQCLENSIRHTEKGSIVIFHDSEKSSTNMLYALPRFLEHFSAGGYSFPVLASDEVA